MFVFPGDGVWIMKRAMLGGGGPGNTPVTTMSCSFSSYLQKRSQPHVFLNGPIQSYTNSNGRTISNRTWVASNFSCGNHSLRAFSFCIARSSCTISVSFINWFPLSSSTSRQVKCLRAPLSSTSKLSCRYNSVNWKLDAKLFNLRSW